MEHDPSKGTGRAEAVGEGVPRLPASRTWHKVPDRKTVVHTSLSTRDITRLFSGRAAFAGSLETRPRAMVAAYSTCWNTLPRRQYHEQLPSSSPALCVAQFRHHVDLLYPLDAGKRPLWLHHAIADLMSKSTAYLSRIAGPRKPERARPHHRQPGRCNTLPT